MNLDSDYNGATRLRNWWGKVKSNFQIIQDWVNTLEDKGVETEYYADKSITTDKLADGAVTTEKNGERCGYNGKNGKQ